VVVVVVWDAQFLPFAVLLHVFQVIVVVAVLELDYQQPAAVLLCYPIEGPDSIHVSLKLKSANNSDIDHLRCC
jgi:hypothetical protein